MQVILRFCSCYDGKINGKLLPTLSALKKFESKYPKYGKLKGLFSRETLLALEEYLAANEKYCKRKYKGEEVLNISVKELVQKQKKTSNSSNSSHTSQSQQTSQNSSRTSTSSSSSNSSSSTTINSGSSSSSSTSGSSSSSSSSDSSNSSSSNTSSNSSSSSSSSRTSTNASTPLPNQASTSSTPSTEGNKGSSTPKNPETEKTQEELEKEEIEKGKKSLEKALDNIKDTLQTYTTKLTELQDKINGLQPTSTDSNEKLLVEEKKSSYLKQKEKLETTIQTLTQRQTTLSQQLSTLLGKENITRNDLQNIQNQLTPLQAKVKTLKNDAEKLINEVNSYEKKLTPEKPSGTISPEIGQYFKNLRTFQQKQENLQDKPDLCTSYALTASTEMLKQQGKILPPMSEASAWNLTKISGIDRAFTINKPTTSENIKKQILEAPAGSIMTVRYCGTRQSTSLGVSHAMVSLGGGKYTDLIGDDQRTIDLNKITIQPDPTWGFKFTDNLGKSFRFVTKTDQVTGSGSSILTPRKSLEVGQPTTFDFEQLCSFHNITLNKDVVADFEASGQALTNKIDAFAKQYHLDFSYVKDNVLVKKQNGKYNFRFKSKDIHLFVAWIRGYTGYGNNFIRAKLYEKGINWMKGGSPAGKRITLPSVNVPKKMTNQTNPGGNENNGNTGGTGNGGREQQTQREQVQPISFKLKPENQIKIRNLNIVTFESTVKKNGFEAWKVLSDSKQSIIEFLSKFKDPQTNRPYNLTNREYDIIATKVMGVLFNESRIGAGWSPTSIGSSTGLSQLNRGWRDAEKLRPGSFSEFGINNKQDLEDLGKCTKATMIEMIAKYYTYIKPRVRIGKRVDGENNLMDKNNCFSYLYYAWNKPKNLLAENPTERCHPTQYEYWKNGNECIEDFFGKVP